MNTSRLIAFSAGTLAGAFLLSASSGAPEGLAASAKDAILRFFPRAEITSVEEKQKHDESIWLVRLQVSEENREARVEITPQGQILEIDEHWPVDQLPEKVQRALAKAFPNGEIQKAEMETEMHIIYRLDVQDGQKRRRIKVSRTGRIYEIEKRN